MTPGRRILVYGPAGAGKTTFALALGERLGLPVIEVDAIRFAGPAWVTMGPEELVRGIEAAVAAAPEGWIVEGNTTTLDDPLLDRADTIVWLRLPFRVTYARVVRRTVRRVARGERVWGGKQLTWRGLVRPRSMLVWSVLDWRPSERRTRWRLRHRRPGTRVVILRSQHEVDAFLAATPKPGRPGRSD